MQPDDEEERHLRRGRVATIGLSGVLMVAAVLCLKAAGLADAAGLDFVVDDTADRVDSRVGDGVCRTSAGTCTLRAAIQETNAIPGSDTIVVPGGTYSLAIPPLNQNLADNGDLDITDSLTISGAGAGSTIVDGGTPPAGAPPRVHGLDRLFEVLADGGTVTFSGLTINGGYAAEYGGAVMNNSTATVTVTGSRLTANVADKAGGAIDNHLGGAVYVVDSTLTNNVSFESGSALNNNRDGTLTVENSTVVSNSAADIGLDQTLVGAGAIANNAELDLRGTIIVTRSQVIDNASGGARVGAALSNDGAGTVSVDETSFSKNRSELNGGAIFNGAGEVTVTGSTFSENAGENGGAIFNSTKDGRLTVSHSTFSLNTADARGGAIANGGTGSVTVTDSAFSQNSADGWGGAVANDDKGSVAILNSSFRENSGLNGGGFGNEGDGLVTVENSTFTKNNAFVSAVLASGEGGGIHSNSSGDVVITGGSFAENTARNGGGLGNEGGGQLIVTGTRFTANKAEEKGGGVLIQAGTVRMLDIDVIGNFAGAAIEAGGGIAYEGDKLVSIGEAAAIENSRIVDNRANGQGGGIDSRGDGPLDIAATRIAGNTAAMGGGIHHVGDAPLEVIRSTLSGNSAESGGGVFTDGDGETTVTNSTVSGNRAGQFGGGLLVSSRLIARNSTVANNTAAAGGGLNNGGGDLVGDGTVFLANTIVANNSTGGNCAGTMTSRGGNLENTNTCRLTELSDQPGTNPRLGPLADNGGPTETHALLEGSPAQERAVCTDVDPCPPVDQRGLERPRFDGHDTGPYESELAPGGGDTQPCAGRAERPVAADFDSWVSQSAPAANFGNDSILKVKSLPGASQRALVHFSLPPAPPGCRLVAATLRLHSSAATAERSLEVHRIGSAWTELGVTWAAQPATAGPAATTQSGLGALQWDVLEQTRDMYALGDHGFLIRDAAEGQSGEHSFHGTEKGIDGRPELLLVFDDPNAPPPPDVCPTTPQLLLADSDSWVSEGSPANNFGTDSTLKVKSQLGVDARTLVRFSLPSLPAGCTTIASAVLRLDASSATPDRTLEALRIASAWSETGVTWSNQPRTTGSPVAIPSGDGVLEWPVTPLVLDMYVSANHGFVIRDAEENGVGYEQTFNGRLKLNDGPPELVLVFDDSTPETTIDVAPLSPINDTRATFTFSSDRDDSTFECSLDGAPFQACTSPHSVEGLTEGAHTFAVRSTRAVRAVDSTPAEHAFTVDLTAPEAAIGGSPADPTNQTSADFTFSGSDNLDELSQLRFECRLDPPADWGNCTSPASYSNLAAGAHRFAVRAVDRAGNVGAATEQPWTIDLTEPDTTLGERPADPTSDTAASFAFSGSDDLDSVSQLAFQCRLDAAPDAEWQDCESPAAYDGLTEGGHSFQARALDRAGNVDTSPEAYSWRIDLTAPVASISERPPDPSRSNSAGFAFAASDDLSAPAALELQCRLDSADEAGWQACSSPASYDNLSEGTHRFDVRAVDEAGNVGPAAEAAWTVDLTAPEATISEAPADPTNQTSARFAFSASDNLSAPAELLLQCRLDSVDEADWQSCESPRDYPGLAAGAHSFQVRGVDAAGNVGAPAEHAWTIDLQAPDTALGARPADPTNERSASFGLAGSDNLDEPAQLSFQCRLDAAPETAWQDCSSPAAYADLGEGAHSFEVRARDRAGNVDESPEAYSWTVDVTAPVASISEAPPDPSKANSASFSFAASDGVSAAADLELQCRLDSSEEADWQACLSPASYPGLSEGRHRFQVRALDEAGNVGEAATHEWTVDLTAPQTSISEAPADPTNATSARFAFAASDDVSAASQLLLQCRLDSADEADWQTCESPQSYGPLAAGSHSFQVRAVDAAGNVGAPAEHAWTVDLAAPETALSERPPDPTNATSASFAFSGSDDIDSASQLAFQCRLDSAAEDDWHDCSSPALHGDLAAGRHHFEVRARDRAGNVDGTPEAYAWTVDLGAPVASISERPPNPSKSNSATFVFAASDDVSAPERLDLQCRLDSGEEADWQACPSPQRYDGLGEQGHRFEVRALDEAGNAGEPATYAWTVDQTAPEATISQAPADPTNATSARFAFAASDAVTTSSELLLQCRLDSADEADWQTCESPQSYGPLAAGSHSFQVRAVDAAGNVGAPAEHAWTVDLAAPETALSERPPDPTNATSASFAFSGSDDIDSASQLAFQCRLDSCEEADWQACPSPQRYDGLGEGGHRFEVRAVDEAGNAGEPATYAWTVDLTAPEASISEKPTDPTNATSAHITFAASDAVTASSELLLQCRRDSADEADWQTCSSPASYDNLSEGGHRFEVRAIDAAGNVGVPAEHAWTIDLTAPDTAVGERPADPTNDNSASFSFTGSDDVDAASQVAFQCRLDGAPEAPWQDCESPAAYADLAEGAHSFQVRAIDRAGNVDASPETYAWTVDVTDPESAISGRPAEVTRETSASLAFTGSDNLDEPSQLSFQCRLDSVSDADWAACSSPQGYELLGEGPHRFQVRALDRAGNVGAAAEHAWTVDVTGPETTIEHGPADPTNQRSASLAFAGTDNLDQARDLSFHCRLDDEPDFAACSSPQGYELLAPGPHRFHVRAVDRAGNVGAAAEHAWTIDVTAPDTLLGERPADPTNETAASFTFSGSDDLDQAGQLGFQCRLDSAADADWRACTSPASYRELGEGAHSFEVRALDRAANVDESAEVYSWRIDVTSPETSISQGPSDPSKSGSASFAFAASDDLSASSALELQCRLDATADAGWQPCSSPASYHNLSEDAHRFQVRAVDEAGNVGAAAEHPWTVDLTAPKASISEKPADPTNHTSARFAFSASDNLSASAELLLQCRLDSIDEADWQTCESPRDYAGLPAGAHRFHVRAVDRAGNVGADAEHAWTVDLAAPDTLLNGRPADPTTSTSAQFTFSSSEGGSTFECALDTAAFAECTSPHEYTGLDPGRHTFRVQAKDRAGNVDPEPATYTWTIQGADVTAPETAIGTRPGDPTNQTGATFSFTGTDDVSAPSVLRFECRLDSSLETDWESCSSPKGYAGPLAAGRHTFEVRAIDEAGNEDASPAAHAWTIDTSAPETEIGSGPADPTNQTVASFSFTGSDNTTAASALSFQCRVDSSFAADWESCSSPTRYSALDAGRHTFEVRAIDAAGNSDGSPAGRSWTIDLTAPETTIESGPAGLTNDSTPTYSFSSEPGATFQCRVDGAPFAACTSPHTTTALSDGAHTFEVRATDAAGNPDGTPATTAITVDTVAPETTIDSGPSGLTNDSTPTYSFSSEPGSTFQCRVDAAPFAACTSPQTTTPVADGAHTFEVRATDAAGNTDTSPAGRTITVDTVAPETTIDSGPSGLTNDSTPTYSFSSEPGASLQCRVDTAAFTTCTSPHTTAPLSDGAHTFEVRGTDAAANTDTSPASRTITVDTAAPETTIGDRPPPTTTSTSATFTFSSEPGATFECALDAAAFGACTSPKAYTGLAVDPHEFRVRARDAAGNVDGSAATYSWTITSPAPACPTTTTLAAVADAWIDQNSPANNKGGDSILKVQSKGPSDNFRALVRFSLPALPQGCVVESATLRLYAASAKTGRTLDALRLAAAWSENAVTWASQPATTGTAASTTSDAGYREWNVVSQVRAMYDGGANHGFLIRDAVENTDAEQQFHSREKGESPPQLVLRFTAPPG